MHIDVHPQTHEDEFASFCSFKMFFEFASSFVCLFV